MAQASGSASSASAAGSKSSDAELLRRLTATVQDLTEKLVAKQDCAKATKKGSMAYLDAKIQLYLNYLVNLARYMKKRSRKDRYYDVLF